MFTALNNKGYSVDDANFIIDMYLGGELRGHSSHGLANFTNFLKKDFSSLSKPEVIYDTNSAYIVDAKSNSGNLVGKFSADQAMDKADNEIFGVAIIKNMEHWERPGAIAQYIAEKGYVAIVLNSGGVANIAPPGGFDRTLGTNPIAYGIPMVDGPLVVDMATSKRAWGQVRKANKFGTDLPEDSFYNDSGEITRDPAEAHSVLPFGDYKGYAIALLVEVLCGSLIGRAMMIVGEANSSYGTKTPERGGVIIAIKADTIVGLEQFKTQNSEFIDRIEATRPLQGSEIRIPGKMAGELEKRAIENDTIDIPDELWNEISLL